MGNSFIPAASQPPEILEVVQSLIEMLEPRMIYLYNQRVGESGKAQGFKLCIIAKVADKNRAEQNAYTKIDCEIPFDILIYTPREWERLVVEPDSFASKIFKTGTILYGG